MSRSDRARWNERYRAGSYGARPHASDWLRRWYPALALPAHARALDVACGAGRNALFLAEQGARVTAVDISQVALEQGAERGMLAGHSMTWAQADLERGWRGAGLPAAQRFDLIVVVRYLNLPLLTELQDHLNPGGWLLAEVHGPRVADVGGPGGEQFRASAAQLRAAVPNLHGVALEAGLVRDPDQRLMALSRLLARRRRSKQGLGSG